MLQTFKKELRLYGKDFWVFPAFLAGGFVFGLLLLLFMQWISHEPPEWFPMGTLMAGFLGLLSLFLFGGIGMNQRYMLALSMGQPRKPQILCSMLMMLLQSLSVVVLLWPISLLDLQVARLLGGADPELAGFLLRCIRLPQLLIAVPPVFCIAYFVAAIHGRFGRKGSTALYLLFIGSCIIPPRLVELLQRRPDGALAAAFHRLSLLPPLFWILLAAAILLLLLVIALRMLLRLQVSL